MRKSVTGYRTSLSLPLFDRICACRFANSHHASFTPYLLAILHFICSLFYPIPSRYLTTFCEFICRFYAIYYVVILHHLPVFFILHFYIFSAARCQPFL